MEMKDPVTFLGITFERGNMKHWEKTFEEVRFDDEIKLKSKEVFQHGEDNEPFNRMTYRYVIIAENGEDTGYTIKEDGEEVEADLYSAYLVPTPDIVPDSKIMEVAQCFGLDDLTAEEARKELDETDLADYGLGVFLGSTAKKTSNAWDDNILDGLATALETVDVMRGFWLDRPMNGIGMTGWDFLEMALTEKSFRDYV